MFLSFSFIIFENQNSDKNSLKLFLLKSGHQTISDIIFVARVQLFYH